MKDERHRLSILREEDFLEINQSETRIAFGGHVQMATITTEKNKNTPHILLQNYTSSSCYISNQPTSHSQK
jgi:hypothetical protein